MGSLTVLAAALVGFLVGAVWYMILGRAWLSVTGIELDDTGRPIKGAGALPFVVSGVAMILVAGMMRHIFSMAGIDGAAASLVAGLGVGAFFISPWLAVNYAFAMRPLKLFLIDAGYAILGSGAIGLTLGLLG